MIFIGFCRCSIYGCLGGVPCGCAARLFSLQKVDSCESKNIEPFSEGQTYLYLRRPNHPQHPHAKITQINCFLLFRLIILKLTRGSLTARPWKVIILKGEVFFQPSGASSWTSGALRLRPARPLCCILKKSPVASESKSVLYWSHRTFLTTKSPPTGCLEIDMEQSTFMVTSLKKNVWWDFLKATSTLQFYPFFRIQ